MINAENLKHNQRDDYMSIRSEEEIVPLRMNEFHLTILQQLMKGACCRTHLHTECGLEINKSRTENEKFDTPLNELLEAKMIRRVGKISRYMIYKITSKGEQFYDIEQKK